LFYFINLYDQINKLPILYAFSFFLLILLKTLGCANLVHAGAFPGKTLAY